MFTITPRDRTLPVRRAWATTFGFMTMAVSLASSSCGSKACDSVNGPACASTPQTLATLPSGSIGIVVDETNVYALEGQTGPLAAIPVDGGDAVTVGATVSNRAVAVDERRLYWSDGTTLFACDKTHCADSTVTLALAAATQLRVEASYVYWSTNDSPGALMKVAKNGGQPIAITAVQNVWSFTVDAENIYWTGWGGVHKAPLGGGAPVNLANLQTEVEDIEGSGDNLYFVSAVGSIFTVPKKGGPTSVVFSNLQDGRCLAVDGANLYFVSHDRLMRLDLVRGELTTLFTGLGFVSDIEVDGGSVYVLSSGDAFQPSGGSTLLIKAAK